MNWLPLLAILFSYTVLAWPYLAPAAIPEPPPLAGWKPRVYRRVAMLGERRALARVRA